MSDWQAKWHEVAARRWREGDPIPPFVGRLNGIMGKVDSYKSIGLVKVMCRVENVAATGERIERLMVWPTCEYVERELAAFDKVSRRVLHNAIAVDLVSETLVLVLSENVFDGTVYDLVTNMEKRVWLDEIRPVEDYGYTPQPTWGKLTLLRTAHGELKWPLSYVPREATIHKQWKAAVARAIHRRYT